MKYLTYICQTIMYPLCFLKSFFSIHFIFFLIAIYSLLAIQMKNFASDSGIGWHLKTGEYIVKNHGIPYFDPFLSFETVRAWVSDQWLSDLIFYLIYNSSSWTGLTAVLTVLYLLTFFLVLYKGLVKNSGEYIFSTFACLYAFKVAQVHFILRPVMISFLFFATIYIALLNINRLKNVSNKQLVLIPLLFLFWCNLHPAFILGLALLALFWISLIVDFLVSKKQDRSLLKSFSLLLLTSSFTTLVNPYFYNLHISIFQLGSSKYFMQLHQEWQSISFSDYSGKLFLFSVIVIVLALLTDLKNSFKKIFPSTFFYLLVICFFIQTVSTIRFLPFWGIIISYPLILSLQQIGRWVKSLSENSKSSWYLSKLSRFEVFESNRNPSPAIIIICLFLLGYGLIFHKLPLSSEGIEPPYAQGIKEVIGEVLSDAKSANLNAPYVVAAHPHFGGLLTLYGENIVKPIIDDRNILIGEAFYRNFYEKISSTDNIYSYLLERKANYLLLPIQEKVVFKTEKTDKIIEVYRNKIMILYRFL